MPSPNDDTPVKGEDQTKRFASQAATQQVSNQKPFLRPLPTLWSAAFGHATKSLTR
jgi:hypothetical protein